MVSRHRIGDLAIRAPRDPNAAGPVLRTTARVIDRVEFLASAVRRGDDMAAEGTVVQLGGDKTALEAILGQRRASALEQLTGGAQRADIGDPSTGVIRALVAQRSTAPPAVSVELWS